MRLLIITPLIPDPRREGAAYRLLKITRLIMDLGVEVTLLPLHRKFKTIDEDTLSDRNAFWASQGIIVPNPTNWESYVSNNQFEYYWYDSFLGANIAIDFIKRLRADAKHIFDTVDLGHVREFREAKLTGKQKLLLKAIATKKTEVDRANQADVTLVVSEQECATLKSLAPNASILVLPNIHELADEIPSYESRVGVGIIGSYHHGPNVDAVRWLCEEIWPRCVELSPDLNLSIIGSGPLDEESIASTNNCKRVGYIEDLPAYLQRLRLTVAPLRYGAGIKGKVLESIAKGTPVVGTDIASEGLNLDSGDGILVANTTNTIANFIVRLHQEKDLWERTAMRGHQKLRHQFTQDHCKQTLLRIFDR
ncbi:MAG: glycosyltransferase [Verrucomicrobiota bacterium]